MTIYPAFIDNILTLPPVSGSSQEDVAITALRSAVFAVETELGIAPRGIYPDVRTRLDILESRINFSVSPVIPNDGYVKSPLYIWNVPSNLILSISDGYGAPTENRLDGSLYMRGDGYANNELYVRRSGLWYPIQTDLWTAGGDLSGTYLNQEVIGIRTKPLDVSLETIGSVQDGYHLTWSNSDGYWRAETGFLATNDLSPASGSGPTHGFTNTGRTAQTVVGIQNKKVTSENPTDGYVVVWEATDNHFDYHPQAVVFGGSLAQGDGYITRTNIRSNKILQSPSTNNAGRTGMVNFGTSTRGIGGVSADFASILGGDNNTASGQFGTVLSGALNTASDGYSLILDGYNNSAAGQYSTVMNGTLNVITLTGTQSFILDGYSNNISGTNAFVLDGYNNVIAANYSGILNGQNNSIAAGNTHSWIGFGSLNSITSASATYSMILGGSGNSTSAQNAFLGNPTNSSVESLYGTVLNGLNNAVTATSNFSTILGGNTNIVNGSSAFSFIGTGNNINVSGLYATVLNSTVATVVGLHSTILNGNTNSITGTFSTIGNGNNNTISSNPSYATILDGYSNTITSVGGLIVDGYSNSVSGIWSSVLNGNNNTVAGSNSTVLNGSSNSMDASSPNNVVLFGTSNVLTSSTRSMIAGNGNTLSSVTNAFLLGQFNNVQGAGIKITGDSNIVGSGTSMVRIYGNLNNVGANTTQTTIFGSSNTLVNSTTNNAILGSNNLVDGYGNSTVVGQNNIANANYSMVRGQYGKSRLYGQEVYASSRFTAGKIGEAQWSRLVLTGNGGPGASFLLQLQDTSPTNMTFVDGYSYELNIRVMVISTAPTTPFPVVTTRYVFNVLIHQEGGVLVIDNINRDLETPNGSTWTVSVSGWGLAAPTNNQFQIQVDNEQTPYIQGTPSTRRAIATVDMREISRL